MSLRVVGAGLARTGTNSLKVAMEQLLGGRCYHMYELFGQPGHVGQWRAAIRGEPIDWDALFDGWAAAVDWPASALWREIAAANPDAVILLSEREDPQTRWRSARPTVFDIDPAQLPDDMSEWYEMYMDLLRFRFTERWREPDEAMAAYERHNADVRASASSDRLVEWKTGDGWGPLCAALGVPVPDEPFPHTNTTADFLARRAASATMEDDVRRTDRK